MTKEQKTVAVGAASGIGTMIVLVFVLHRLLPQPAVDTMADRIAYGLSWAALAAVPLFAMIVAVGNARFSSEAIDPTANKETPRMVVDGRAADNTVQQFLLFLAGSLALAVNIPAAYLTVIGAAAITYTAMRFAFWYGYRIRPLYRAFGFAGTAYLNLGLLAAALWFALG